MIATPISPITWKPSAEITSHSRQPLPSNLVFFVPPPPEIGKVRSAYSTLELGKSPVHNNGFTIGFCIAAYLFVGIPISIFLYDTIQIVSRSDMLTILAILLINALTISLIWWFFKDYIKIDAFCSYVGDDGVACYFWGNKAKSKVLLFDQATELRTRATRHSTNGQYTFTSYEYWWNDANKKIVGDLAAIHSKQTTETMLQATYYFVLAAENAWSVFAYERARDELKQNGKIRFNLIDDRALILGNGFVEIINGNKSTKLDTSEVDLLTLERGMVTLRKANSRKGFFGIGSSGVFRFDYSQIANARLFIMLFDALVGVNVQN